MLQSVDNFDIRLIISKEDLDKLSLTVSRTEKRNVLQPIQNMIQLLPPEETEQYRDNINDMSFCIDRYELKDITVYCNYVKLKLQSSYNKMLEVLNKEKEKANASPQELSTTLISIAKEAFSLNTDSGKSLGKRAEALAHEVDTIYDVNNAEDRLLQIMQKTKDLQKELSQLISELQP